MIYRIILLVICSALYIGAVQAQDNTNPDEPDSSSEQAEAREDAYRKRMELEGSRDHETFSNITYTSQARQEKIDKLPKESRDNIRDQLTDVIIENGQWEPFDALREYPYEPSEAAQDDPGLREHEQEAWAEQMEKYHKREASAFEASRPSMPGSDSLQAGESPGGQQGREQSEQSQSKGGAEGEGEQQGESQGGEGESQGEGRQQGSQGSNSSSASSYDPYQSRQNDDADEISTAGVAESALDFLKTRQGQGSGSAVQAASSQQAMEQQEMFSQAKDGAEDGAGNESATAQQNSQDSRQSSESESIIPGTIAIKDLDKLEGMKEPEEDDAENQ